MSRELSHYIKHFQTYDVMITVQTKMLHCTPKDKSACIMTHAVLGRSSGLYMSAVTEPSTAQTSQKLCQSRNTAQAVAGSAEAASDVVCSLAEAASGVVCSLAEAASGVVCSAASGVLCSLAAP